MSTLALAGCKSAEERAQEYFESAQVLLEQGDVDRAVIELRNVFQNDEFHREARQLLADTLMARGSVQEAFGQYLRLVEQYPDTIEARLTLAEIAIQFSDWDSVERHGRAAIELAPDLPRAQAIDMSLQFRDAVLARDLEALETAGEKVLVALEAHPDSPVLRLIALEYTVSAQRFEEAFTHVNVALTQAPESYRLNEVKLQLLALRDDPGLGDHLKQMVALFPDEQELKQSLMRWYVAVDDMAGAEAFVRAEAGDLTGPEDAHIDVVQLLMSTQGVDAARAELTKLIEANLETPRADFYRAALAEIDFQSGRAPEAIAALEAILATAEPSDQTRTISVLLARMILANEGRPRAETIVDAVLTEDPSQVDALKMRASWLIADDRAGDAVLALRTAQAQSPRDADIMTLLAVAFERDGSPDLAGEQLSLAVEASGLGEAESLRYAEFLVNQNRLSLAETVLRDARQANGDMPQILLALARVLLTQENWAEVQQIIDLLASAEGEGAEDFQRMAQRLQAAVLVGQNQVSQGLDILREQAATAQGDIRAVVAVVSTQIRSGEAEAARTYLDTELAKTPDQPALRMLSANVDVFLGDLAAAETELRSLIEDEPLAELPARLLYSVLVRQGRVEEAEGVVDAALERNGGSMQLLFIRASILERESRFEEAIAVYEQMYELNSNDTVVANNLASMISTYRDDAESLDRAYAVARRLRSLEVPAFQDTYGWIAYRRGDLQEALPFLEAGAAGLPEEPLAQFHLGMIYADLGQTERAIAQFERTLELAGDRVMPQLEIARERLVALSTEGQ